VRGGGGVGERGGNWERERKLGNEELEGVSWGG